MYKCKICGQIIDNNNICPFCGSDSSNIIEIEETIEKKNKESKETVSMWLHTLCNGDVFDFSDSHDISLNL